MVKPVKCEVNKRISAASVTDTETTRNPCEWQAIHVDILAENFVSECIIFCVCYWLTVSASLAHKNKVVKITKHFIQIQAVLKNYTVKPTNMTEKEIKFYSLWTSNKFQYH
jgi:hypothetical protein